MTAFGTAFCAIGASSIYCSAVSKPPVCVYQTATAALAAEVGVTILTDAIGARRPGDAQVCLETLARAGAHLLPAETVFYALLHDVSHPFFRAYTQLVKSHG